jgi:transcriptional regulator with XRE-family HTH domain
MLKGQWQAARALIGWSQSDLAERVGVTPMTIKRLENHPESVSEDVQAGARAVLEEAGVEFIGGARPGVRLARGQLEGAANRDDA